MKYFLLAIIYICSFSRMLSKPLLGPPVNENTITASKIFVDSKKNIYITGSFTGIVRFSKTIILGSYGSDDIFIAKYNAEGDCLWASNAGSDGFDEGQSIVADEAGYVYVTGLFEGKALFGQIIVKGDKINIFVAKFNPSGDPIWIRTGIGKEGSKGNDIKLDKFNNCYVAGSFYNSLSISNKVLTSYGGNDILVLKFSTKGDLVWGKNFGGKQNDEANTLLLSGDNIYIAGSFNDRVMFSQTSLTSNGSSDAFLSKLSCSSGEIQWAQSFGGKGYDYASGLSSDISGNIYFSGNCDSSFSTGKIKVINNGEVDVFIGKFEASGKNQWIQSFGTGGNEKSTSCVADQVGNFYIGGSFKSNFDNQSSNAESLSLSNEESLGNDLFLIKYKGSLKDKWNLLAGGNGNDEVVDLYCDPLGNIYILGSYDGSIKVGGIGISNNGGVGVFFAKLNPASTYEFVKNAISPDHNFGDQSKYVNYYAKLMHGKDKSSLREQVVNLKDSKGEVIQSTKTDMYGDFSFKGISASETVNIVLGKSDSISAGEPVFLANQKGEVTKELVKDKNNDFAFDILSSELMKLTAVSNEDNTSKLKNFKSGKETEVTISENILYQPGEFTISPENVLEITKLVNVMRQNPNYIIEIYSYTDAIGEAQSNMTLSEKRAKSIVDFFVKKGVKAERVIGKGFGETKIINKCLDGVDCSDMEQSVNRRTEFKFIKDKK